MESHSNALFWQTVDKQRPVYVIWSVIFSEKPSLQVIQD